MCRTCGRQVTHNPMSNVCDKCQSPKTKIVKSIIEGEKGINRGHSYGDIFKKSKNTWNYLKNYNLDIYKY